MWRAPGLSLGLLVIGRLVAAEPRGTLCFRGATPETTALGALLGHVTGAHRIEGRPHEPQNVNWGMFPALTERVKKKESKGARVERAMRDFEGWAATHGEAIAPRAVVATVVQDDAGAAS